MEAQDLIYLVSCAVSGVTPDGSRVAGMDLDALYKLACRHMLAATVAPALKAAGIQDERFSHDFEHSALKSGTMDMEMNAIFAELDAAGIWHMPLKGIVLQHMYPIYGMRQMCDHDILYDASRAKDVRAIMERLGFRTMRFGSGDDDIYHKPPVSNFEMHRTMLGPCRGEKLWAYYRDVRDRLLGDGYEKHLSPEDFYLYLVAHEYKHYCGFGTGLRSFLDTYVFLKKEALDMDYVAAEAKKMGLAEFEADNRGLSLRLFSGETLTERDREMLDYALSSGASGNYDNRVANGMRKVGGSRLRYALNRFFVPISRKSSRYAVFANDFPFFYRHKLLLPFLPFYRIFRAMKNGRFLPEARAIKNAKAANAEWSPPAASRMERTEEN